MTAEATTPLVALLLALDSRALESRRHAAVVPNLVRMPAAQATGPVKTALRIEWIVEY
jgi:hypothetical protein